MTGFSDVVYIYTTDNCSDIVVVVYIG